MAIFYAYSYLARKLNSVLLVLECIMRKLNQLRERFEGLRRFIRNRPGARLNTAQIRDPNVRKVTSDLQVETKQQGD